MGKGDRKTKRGKIFRNTYGVRRPKKKHRIKNMALSKNPQENAPDLKDKMADIQVEKDKEASGKNKKASTGSKSPEES